MTREEAIELLEQHKAESEEDYWIRRAEALGLAIEALKENEKLKQELKEVKQELATFKALC